MNVTPQSIRPRQSLNERYDLVHLTDIEVERPAFLQLVKSPNGGSDLFISSFSVVGGSKVSAVENVGERIYDGSSIVAHTLTEKVDWPNEISPQPLENSDPKGRRLFAVPSGFLVPGHDRGSMVLMATNSPEPDTDSVWGALPITEPKPGWFYHRAEWRDMNDDGRLDLVTARAHLKFGGKAEGELLWLEQPENPWAETWKEHILATGPDVHFRVTDLDNDGQPEYLAAEFFSKQITLHGPEGVKVVDNQLGSAFDLEVTDLNGDGKPELLATNHEGGKGGKVLAYEIPERPYQQEWPKHTLLEGIETRAKSFNAASPGQAHAFRPETEGKGLPWVLVSGDGSERAHLLEPTGNFRYQEHIVVDTGCTVGQSAVGDVNRDGLTELFIPAFEQNKIHVFGIVPKSRG